MSRRRRQRIETNSPPITPEINSPHLAVNEEFSYRMEDVIQTSPVYVGGDFWRIINSGRIGRPRIREDWQNTVQDEEMGPASPEFTAPPLVDNYTDEEISYQEQPLTPVISPAQTRNSTARCLSCGTILNLEDPIQYRTQHCRNCVSECQQCGQIVPTHRLRWSPYLNGQPCNENHPAHVCDNCIIQCNCCGRYSGSNTFIYYRTPPGRNESHPLSLCEHCFRSYYMECPTCGQLCHRDNMTTCNRCQLRICRPCRDYHRNTEHPETVRPESSFIYDYSFKPTPIFIQKNNMKGLFLYLDDMRLPKDMTEILFEGVELEIDKIEGEVHSLAQKLITSFNSFIYLKQDGSLSNKGMEIVSHPATLEAHKEIIPWKHIFDMCVKFGAQSHNTQTCGFHIHFNKQFFNGTKQRLININTLKLIHLFEKFENELVQFSRRSPHLMGHCIPNKLCKKDIFDDLRAPSTIERDIELGVQSDKGRHQAINICNYNTIEIRLWRGTLNLNTFFATLEFTNNLVKIIKQSSVKEIQQYLWPKFQQDILDIEPSTYLKPYLERIRLLKKEIF